MSKVQRHELMPTAEYDAVRDQYRQRMMAIKAARRVHLGSHLTFLFENHDTMLYQVQEMLRAEATTAEADIQHELETYNQLIGGPGELGCTLLIEIDDPLQRDIVLRKWLELPKHLYLRTADGALARARYDAAQIGTDRLSSVQYLLFRCGDSPPVAIGMDLPSMELEAALSEEQAAALAADLAAA